MSITVQFVVGAALVNLLPLADTHVHIGYRQASLLQRGHVAMEIVPGLIMAVTHFRVSMASMLS